MPRGRGISRRLALLGDLAGDIPAGRMQGKGTRKFTLGVWG